MTDLQTAPARPRAHRLLVPASFAFGLAFLLQFGGFRPILDWDMFHEMALARETLALGHVPLQDSFAYTPTVSPVVHHEWGMGMLLLPVATLGGMTGLFLLLLAFIAGILLASCATARARGAVPSTLALAFLIAGPLGLIGYGAVRAQFASLLFMAVQLFLLETDRRGKRWWMLVWPVLYVAWVNIHGGFLVGLGIMGLCWFECAVRSRSLQPRLLVITLGTLALSVVSPYGHYHILSVIAGTLMPRPLIEEWGPLWTDAIRSTAFGLSLVPLLYAIRKLGPRQMIGLPLVAVCAFLAIRHVRHSSLYAVVWLAYVPAWFSQTPAGQWLEAFWHRRGEMLQYLLLILTVAVAAPIVVKGELQLRMPTRPEDVPGFDVFYPVGPVAYLRSQEFEGNVYTPFEMGSFLSWKRYPAVKVSIDSRFEVAYPPESVKETQGFYRGAAGWRDTLAKYPTDLVLTRNSAKVAPLLAQEPGWTRIYVDDVYSLYARAGLMLPVQDQTHQPLPPSFP